MIRERGFGGQREVPNVSVQSRGLDHRGFLRDVERSTRKRGERHLVVLMWWIDLGRGVYKTKSSRDHSGPRQTKISSGTLTVGPGS